MKVSIRHGIWPTMITPYTADQKVDFRAVELLVDWYIQKGCTGVFAVCQSSEMFYLTEEEKVDIARCVVQRAAGRLQVVASGHTADDLPEQIEQLERMSKTGVDVVVLVSNRLAKQNESDAVFTQNAQKIFDALPDVAFGMYECPYPYHRLVSLPFLDYCMKKDKLYFLKDTSCSEEILSQRIRLAESRGLSIFNANTATMLEALRMGAAGFNGVMLNFHPDIYRWLFDHHTHDNETIQQVYDFLVVAGVIEAHAYPSNAKYHMQLEGIPIETISRSVEPERFNENARREVEHLFQMEKSIRRMIHLEGG